MQKPNYGVVVRYLGEQGRDYFDWQGRQGEATAIYNKHIWQSYITRQDDVLDFGCGGGFLLHKLDARRKIGVEINPYARACAQAQAIETYESLDEVKGLFDKVISSHALEHVPHPWEAITEMRSRLRGAESRLILLLPLDDWRSSSQRRYQPSDVNMHLYAWTPQTLGNLLASCDLRVVEVRVIQHAWPPFSDLLWRMKPALFHSMAFLWSGLMRRRQLLAVASLS